MKLLWFTFKSKEVENKEIAKNMMKYIMYVYFFLSDIPELNSKKREG